MLHRRWLWAFVAALPLIAALILMQRSAAPAEKVPLRPGAAAPLLAGQAAMPGSVTTLTQKPEEPGEIPVAIPHTVDFSQALISTEQADSMYNRWRRGELKEENEGLLSEFEMEQLRAAALKLPPDPSVQIAPTTRSPNAPTPAGAAFASIDYTQSGGTVPPDPELAVGPNHAIAVVNVAVAIYNKNGTVLLGPTAAKNLFSQVPCTSDLYDPNVIYDEEHDRWFLAYDQGPQSATGGYCVLVSQTGNPMGLWHEYFFQINSAAGWMDYPHAGIGDQYIVMGGNIFTIVSPTFVEGRIYGWNKADLYAGNPATTVTSSVGSDGPPQPLNLHGYSTGTWPAFGNEHYILTDPYNGTTYNLRRWNVATNTLVTVGSVNLGAGAMTVNWPQNGSGLMQGNDFRIQDFEYRNGYGWTTQTIGCNPGSGTVNCIRWAQINLTNAAIGPEGSGTYSSNGDHRMFADLAVNHCDDMTVGYTKSNTSMFPGIWYTGRENSDAAGTLQAETQLKAGEIAYTAFDGSPFRWGDYTGMTIDPDGLTFWYLGEYSKNTGTTNGRWGTFIGSFAFASCGISPTFTVDVVDDEVNICQGSVANTTTDVGAFNGYSGSVALSASGQPAGVTVGFSPNPVVAPGSSNTSFTATGGATVGSYVVTVEGNDGSESRSDKVALTVEAPLAAGPTLSSPTDGAMGVSLQPTFSWAAVSGATGYQIEIATDSAFSSVVDSATVATTSYTPAAPLTGDTLYYWRVTASNSCGSIASTTAAFQTAPTSLICTTPNLAIPDSNTTGITSTMSGVTGGTISDLNVPLTITHTWVGDLIVTLRHVDTNTSVTIVDRPGRVNSGGGCSQDNIDAILDDEGTAGMVEAACPPAGGQRYVPNNLLAAFDGQALAGSWALTVSDVVGDDTGTLNEWCLEATEPATSADYSDLASGYGVAWHTGTGSLRLGNLWDADSSFAASSDDPSDDGVGVDTSGAAWGPGKTGSATVQVTGGAGYLAGWFDWNNDGDFADSGEQAIGQAVSAGTQTVAFAIPATANTGQPVRARFRLYTSEPLRPTPAAPSGTEIAEGPTSGGEVEDYTISPLAVTLAAFSAAAQGEGITLLWETASEQHNLGFNLWRGTSAAAPTAQLNAELIPAEATGSGSGASYQWTDGSAEAGTSYWYWLEAVDVQGATQRFGPVSATASVPTAVTLGAIGTAQGAPGGSAASALLALTLAALALMRRRR